MAPPATHRYETTNVMSTSKPQPASASGECNTRSSPSARSRATVASRGSTLVAVHPNSSASQLGTTAKRPSRKFPPKNKAAAPTYKPVPLTAVGVGSLISSHTTLTSSPALSSGTPRSPRVLISPGVGERARRIRDLCPPSLPPSSAATSVPCTLYDLHHALQHRLVEDFGWSIHWYLDTETEIKQLEVFKELDEKTKHPSHKTGKPTTAAAERMASEAGTGNGEPKSTAAYPRVNLTADQQDSPAPGGSLKGNTSSLTSPHHSDPNTPQRYHRLDVDGRELPFLAQKSKFGVITNRFDCYMCHDLSVEARSAASQVPRSRLSRTPFEYRLASLQRWLRKRSVESDKDGLLASCLSLETQRYLAYLGLADCWTSLFVTAGLPTVTSMAASSPSSPREATQRFPTTLSGAASRHGSVPLSFYALPALCRWKCVTPFRRDRILRESVMHPFPLPEVFLRDCRGASLAQLQSSAETSEAQEAPADVSHSLPSLTFFTIQQRSFLSERRRTSMWRNQAASLGEICACDVYLVAATGRGAGAGAAAADTMASVWGYVKREDLDSRTVSLPSSPSSAAQQCKGGRKGSATTTTSAKSPFGELFYIASSLENYLRLGLVFGWVYGWQLCFSSAGPPPNSVLWLCLVNRSAYEAALAASKHTAP